MKRALVILLGIIPFVLFAQQKCIYFEKMVELEVEKTEVNTSHSDFGPAFVQDELWFSAYTKEEIRKLNRGIERKIYYNLFKTKLDEGGNVVGDKIITLEEESEGYHVSSVSFCEATGELFVTLSNFEDPDIKNRVFQKANIGLKIIIAKKQNGVWKKTGELPFNNPKYSVGHPAVSVTGDTLYFTSNIPGKGQGGADIYMATRTNGNWGEMVNLGDKINTAGDDMFPFIYKGKLLIFASNGRNGGNDLDLYSAGLMGDKVISPSAIDVLNTDADDFAFVIHPTQNVGYFSSDRTGGNGHDDIYKVIITPGKYELELLVKNKDTKELVPGAKVTVNGEPMSADGDLFKMELAYNSSYQFETDMADFVNDSKTISTKDLPFGVIKETLWVQKPEVGVEFVMENIYYDFDKWDILPESAIELDKLVRELKRNPGWKVELGSHTDCRGKDKYNEVLSQKRSDSAVGYIVKHGVSKDRIIAKGYGETQLVNRCDDGIDCSEEEHRLNRRTVFKILEIE